MNELRRARRMVGRVVSRTREGIVRTLYGVGAADRPRLAPDPIPGPKGLLRIHVGCGSVALPGWYNVDERWFPHVHRIGSAERLSEIPDGAAERLYASHVLEHISHPRTAPTLREWARVLDAGGELYVAVPDFDKIVARYVDEGRDLERIVGPLMGEQDYAANTHMAVFNRPSLTRLLEQAGFGGVRPFAGDEILGEGLWDNSKHPISLNLVATKR